MDKKVFQSRVFIAAIVAGVCSVGSALGYQLLTPEQQETIINALTIILAFIP